MPFAVYNDIPCLISENERQIFPFTLITEHPDETRRASTQTPDEEDTAPATPADPATGRPTDAGTGTTPG